MLPPPAALALRTTCIGAADAVSSPTMRARMASRPNAAAGVLRRSAKSTPNSSTSTDFKASRHAAEDAGSDEDGSGAASPRSRLSQLNAPCASIQVAALPLAMTTFSAAAMRSCRLITPPVSDALPNWRSSASAGPCTTASVNAAAMPFPLTSTGPSGKASCSDAAPRFAVEALACAVDARCTTASDNSALASSMTTSTRLPAALAETLAAPMTALARARASDPCSMRRPAIVNLGASSARRMPAFPAASPSWPRARA